MSERTLRRRLSKQLVDGAERDDMGQWRIPTAWLDAEFNALPKPDTLAPQPVHDTADAPVTQDGDNLVIDLRDTSIASGLAEALADVGDLTNRVIEAEVTAALAANESDKLNTQVRRLQGDLDAERARAERVLHDLAETENALALERDRRARADRDLAALQSESSETEEINRAQIDRLRDEHTESTRRLAALEAFVGTRKREKFRRFLSE